MSRATDAPVCNAIEPTGAKGDDGGPARCTRKPHPPGTMHEGNGLDWYDEAVRPTRPDPETAAALREAVRRAERRARQNNGSLGVSAEAGMLIGLVSIIVSRLEAGERPLLCPEGEDGR